MLLYFFLLFCHFTGLIAGNSIYPIEDEVSGREGQSVKLICQYQTTANYPRLYWYRHHSDLQAPQFILWKGAKRETDEYIPDNRYGSRTTPTSTTLTITELTPADTALYYCALSTYGLRWTVFGKATKLTVKPNDPTDDAGNLFVLNPLHPEGVPQNKLADEVCLATNFRPKGGDMVLNVRQKREVKLNTSNAVISEKDKNYYYAGFANETIFSCEINGMSSNNENVDLCADLRPDKTKLNLYLLLMNGVRVVFTKVLAFSTIFTIRAVLP